jgi:hypothetical protein
VKPTFALDTEVFPDYFLMGLRAIGGQGAPIFFELCEGRPFDQAGARKLLQSARLVTFNGNHFDMLMIALALDGRSTTVIHQAATDLIQTNFKPWQVADRMRVRIPKFDHIDLIEVAPGQSSLKIYAGRLHAPTIQDLPFEPGELILTAKRRAEVRAYCGVDLDNTALLYEALKPQIELRERMGVTYEHDYDLRSKGDAQIAEHVISKEVERLNGFQTVAAEVYEGKSFKYQVPDFIGFQTPKLKHLLDVVRGTNFIVQANGKVDLPITLEAEIRIGTGVYRLGIGGLHSSEKTIAHKADAHTILIDRDVSSYYPAIILNCGLFPEHMGPSFLKVYRRIVEQRLEAKAKHDKVTDAVLKIVINGSFGKLGQKYSALYAPDLLIQVTLTGQLALLMLIEHLECNGIQVVSANTDGIVIRCAPGQQEKVAGLICGWELVTGFRTEETLYSALYSRDVNNYLALKEDGSIKAKGIYAPSSLAKNPTSDICVDAVVGFLRDGRSVRSVIEGCRDIRRFLTLRKVQGGALDQVGQLIGKTVRWYYSTRIKGPLTYKTNNYQVPRSQGARALQTLPAEFPNDVDYDWYVREAEAVLEDIGAVIRQGDLFHAAA